MSSPEVDYSVAAYPPFLTTEAACHTRTAEIFTGAGHRAARNRVAKLICATCPLRKPCDEWATATRQHGVWGGRTELERKRDGLKGKIHAAV